MNAETNLITWFATLGVGGILAGFMFMFYRKDIKQYTELWKTVTEQLIIVIKEDVAANTRLITMLENLERNAMRKDDIQRLFNEQIFTSRSSSNTNPDST